jgi:hypothetical protein
MRLPGDGPGQWHDIDLVMTRQRTSAALAGVIYVAMWVGFRQHWSWLYCIDWSLLNGAHDIAIRHPMWVRCGWLAR